jgi:hypothetical protein
MPIASPPRKTLRLPVRSLINAALTPSSEGCSAVLVWPLSTGGNPAMAFTRVDFPDPFLPIS